MAVKMISMAQVHQDNASLWLVLVLLLRTYCQCSAEEVDVYGILSTALLSVYKTRPVSNVVVRLPSKLPVSPLSSMIPNSRRLDDIPKNSFRKPGCQRMSKW
jgi:hypothetical protein